VKPDTRDPSDSSDSSQPLPVKSEWLEVEVQIQGLDRALQEIKQRLAQVRTMQGDRIQLKSQQQEVRDRLKHLSTPTHDSAAQQQELKQRLTEIGSQLELLEVELESRLISWSSFREPFWQIVRFSGLGILIGVAIKSCTG
jgi:DNA repair exonuclease SbcCD ATPase subunit